MSSVTTKRFKNYFASCFTKLFPWKRQSFSQSQTDFVMCLPFEADFLYNVVTAQECKVYKKLIRSASKTQMYSLVKLLATVRQLGEDDVTEFHLRLPRLRLSILQRHLQTRSALCAALISFYEEQSVQLHKNGQSLQSD